VTGHIFIILVSLVIFLFIHRQAITSLPPPPPPPPPLLPSPSPHPTKRTERRNCRSTCSQCEDKIRYDKIRYLFLLERKREKAKNAGRKEKSKDRKKGIGTID
jgi:hypothetical protein